MSVDLKRFHATFFAESYKGLDRMEADLLRLERDGPDEDLLNSIFRAVHSVKGSGGSLGFREIAEFSHELESVLDEIRKGRSSVTPRTSELLLSALDCLRSLLRDAEHERPPDEARRGLMKEVLSDLAAEAGPAAAAKAAVPGATQRAAAPGKRRVRISFRPHPRIFYSGNDPLRLFRVLAELGEFEAKADLDGLPDLKHFDPECCYLTWTLELRTGASREQVLDAFEWVKDECKLDYAELDVPAAPAGEPAIQPERRKTDRRQQDRRVSGRRAADVEDQFATSIHVGTDKIDKLVNLVGELVINRTILRDLAENFSMGRLEQLGAALAQLERNTRDLQENVMAVRMLPVSFVFGRFTRLVRDFCQSSGKKVDLKISGEQSELDKTVIEKLIDPLTHLVRNALDHGIEMPEVRRAAGKPETATLVLHAQHKGGSVEIHVRDDGQGLNLEKIRARAIQAGLITADSTLDEATLKEVIFAPGFSTSDSVSDLSGRGVGLDVVRSNIASLGGTVEVSSRSSEGATFVLRLPLTLAILDGMSVGVGSETYIIPLSFILECIQPQPGQAKTISGQGAVFEVRGEYVPFIELGRLLNAGGAAGVDSGIVVVLEAEGKKVAMLVDSLLSQDQVVIKSLETNFRKVPYIAGAMIMGEGRVVLILDVNAVVRSARS